MKPCPVLVKLASSSVLQTSTLARCFQLLWVTRHIVLFWKGCTTVFEFIEVQKPLFRQCRSHLLCYSKQSFLLPSPANAERHGKSNQSVKWPFTCGQEYKVAKTYICTVKGIPAANSGSSVGCTLSNQKTDAQRDIGRNLHWSWISLSVSLKYLTSVALPSLAGSTKETGTTHAGRSSMLNKLCEQEISGSDVEALLCTLTL